MRLYLQIGISAALIYGALGPFIAPDLNDFLFPWLAQIRATGLSQPVGNYTPPYLYLLALGSLAPLSDLAIVKIISALGSILLALSIRRVLIAAGCDKHNEAAAISLLLPTVIANGPALGQCDAIWVGCCLFAVAAAVEKRLMKMAVWAGVAFAFKAQAIFLAPFAIALVVAERKWTAFLVPPAVYLAAITPAWLMGWPLSDLLTIYARQYGYYNPLSTAPNLWALPAAFESQATPVQLLAAYALTAAATAAYFWRFDRSRLLQAALLASMILPYFMPKMHERYFMLADMLAFCLSYASGRWRVFALVQGGSAFALAAHVGNMEILNVIGALFMTAALIDVVVQSHFVQRERRGWRSKHAQEVCGAS